MSKKTVIFGVILCVCLITGSIFADNTGSLQQGQPPMGGPQMPGQQNEQMMQGQPPMGGPQMSDQQNGQQMFGQQNGQMMQGQPPMGDSQMSGQQMSDQQNGHMMQGQPPLKLASVESEDNNVISLLADADSDADVLEEIADGSVVEILEEDGDYVKVSINGTIGYVLSSELSELQPGDGNMPPMPNNGQQPPVKPEDGEEPPAKPEDGEEPPAKPEDGEEPPAKPEDGEEPPVKPEDGQQPPAMPENNDQQPPEKPTGKSMENDSLEPGIQNFFKAILRFLSGETTNS